VTIKIVLVDDQEIVRSGLRLLLQSEADMEIVGEAGDGPGALALCHQAEPDVVVLHIEMPGLDGPQITRAIKQQDPSSAIFALGSRRHTAFPRVGQRRRVRLLACARRAYRSC